MAGAGNAMIFQIVGTIFGRFSRQQAGDNAGYSREQVVDEIQQLIYRAIVQTQTPLYRAINQMANFIIKRQTKSEQPPSIVFLNATQSANRAANSLFIKNM
jgi:hypothetical protein